MKHVVTVLHDRERMTGSATCSCGKWCWTFTLALDEIETQALGYIERKHREHMAESEKIEAFEERILNHRPQITVVEPMRTLRDEFAMVAMIADSVQSAIVAAAYIGQGARFDGDVPNLSTAVKEHYETADAMLEARKKEG